MDRKTILTLVAVTFAFIFFTSDTWHSIVRRTLGIPDPPKVEQVVADTASGKMPVADTSSPRLVDAATPSGARAMTTSNRWERALSLVNAAV